MGAMQVFGGGWAFRNFEHMASSAISNCLVPNAGGATNWSPWNVVYDIARSSRWFNMLAIGPTRNGVYNVQLGLTTARPASMTLANWLATGIAATVNLWIPQSPALAPAIQEVGFVCNYNPAPLLPTNLLDFGYNFHGPIFLTEGFSIWVRASVDTAGVGDNLGILLYLYG